MNAAAAGVGTGGEAVQGEIRGSPVSLSLVGDIDTDAAAFAEEHAVVGALILAAQRVQDEVLTIVRNDDFADARCHFTVGVIRRMRSEQLPVDVVTLLGYVKRNALLDGDAPRGILASWLHEMISAAPVPASAGYYADLVVEQAARRAAENAATAISAAAQGDSLSDLLAIVRAALPAVTVAVERVGGGFND